MSVAQALANAAARQGLRRSQHQPSRDQVQDAVREYRTLFCPGQHDALAAQRQAALDAMHSLAPFHPRLFGGLVDGSGPLDRIELLLQANAAELVIHDLEDRHIPWRSAEHVLYHASGRQRVHPALRFQAGQSSVELVILERPYHSDPARDPVNRDQPLATMSRAELAACLAARTTIDQRSDNGT